MIFINMKSLINEVKRMQQIAGIIKEGMAFEVDSNKDHKKLKREIEKEYMLGGNILRFASEPELSRIAAISPKAAQALQTMNSMMPDDLDIADLSPRLQAKVEKLERAILMELGLDIEDLG